MMCIVKVDAEWDIKSIVVWCFLRWRSLRRLTVLVGLSLCLNESRFDAIAGVGFPNMRKM